MKKGRLIVIEGAMDGIGKSTQFALLKKHLEEDGEEVVTHHFPSYKTEQGKLVELYLEGKLGTIEELSPYFIHSLYAIDRAVTWKKELEQAYLEGKTILLDRYTTSSLLYQSALIESEEEKKEFISYAKDYEYNKLGIKEPDIVFFLQMPFELSLKLQMNRKENEGLSNDLHEKNKDYLYQVYLNAMSLADFLHFERIDCHRGNKLKSIEEIHEEIYQKVKKI